MTAITHSMNPRGVPPGLNQEGVIHMPTIFKVTDVETLADRLYSRGISKMFDDSPSLQGDLRTASRITRALLGKIDSAAAKANDTAALLAEMRIEVED